MPSGIDVGHCQELVLPGADGKTLRAAEHLGISRKNLRQKLRKFGIDAEEWSD